MSRRSRRFRARFASLERLENRTLLDSAMADLAQEWFANGPMSVPYRENVAMVRLTASANPSILATYGGDVAQTPARDIWQVSYDSQASMNAAITGFGQSELIVWAEPLGQVSVNVLPNDPLFYAEWGLNNTGQQYASGQFGTADADIDAPEAWDRRTSALSVVTADIDTGVNYKHPDLYKNIWINQGEIPASRKANLTDVDGDGLITFWDLNEPINIGTNKISDFNGNGFIDGGDLLEPLLLENGVDAGGGWANGVSDEVGGDAFTDDIIGWDFANNDNNPLDDHGHGTHTSGTIGAIGNNNEGVTGVAWKAQIMPLKFLGSDGSGSTVNGANAVAYSALKGAKISNNSWGGGSFLNQLYTAISQAGNAGQLFVASAGNDATNIDLLSQQNQIAYPAAYDLPNIVSVASTTATDAMSSFSNYGVTLVDLGAPGSTVGSTYYDLGTPYVYLSGTSMAAPHVSGAAALVKAQRPSWGWSEIKTHLLSTVDPLASLAGKTVTGGRLNLQKALANVAPTNVALSNNSVPENQPANTTVGTLSSTDPDLGDTFTYTLVAGAGSTDNTSFTITGNTLKTNASFDFEAKSSYSIRVRTTDQGGLFFEKAFTINVTNVNETPTDIGISNSAIAENQPAATTVGSLSTIDPDAGDSFTYTLVSGTGSTDNSSFTITSGILKTAASFDFESKNSYSIRLRSTDAGGLFTEKSFTIGVTNVNETPTDIGLSNNAVEENQPSGTAIGSLSTVDPDAGESFTYSLVSGAGSDDNSSFSIDSGVLKAAASFDFETKSSYSVRVRSTDAGGLFIEKSFTIGVTNANETPTDIGLSNNSVAENEGVGTAIGSLSTVDPDAGDSFTYLLVGGAGSDDNASFTIDSGVLKTAASFDFETKNSYSIRILTTDAGGLFSEKTFTIGVTNVNETPTDIGLSNDSVAESQPSGAAVGSLSTIDPDAGDSFTYSLESGAGSDDNASFTIDSGVLKTAASFDFETKSSYSIRVRSTDAGGLFSEKAFTIHVTDVSESAPPVLGGITGAAAVAYKENAVPVLISSLATITDPDSADFFGGTLTVWLSNNGTADDRLSIKHTSDSAGKIGVDYVGQKVRYGGVQIATYTGGVGTTPLVFTLNNSASKLAVQAALKAITFANVSENPSTLARTVSFTLNDGDGATSSAATRTINVTAANDKPVVTTSGSSVTYTEAGPAVIIDNGVTVSDPDSADFATGKLTVKAASGGQSSDRFGIAPGGLISVSGTTVNYSGTPIGTFAGTTTLTVTLNSNATWDKVQELARHIVFSSIAAAPSTTPRGISFTVSDGDGGTSLAALGDTVNVTIINDAPVLTLTNTTPAKYTENAVPLLIAGTATVVDVDLLDFDTGTLTVALTGNGTAEDQLGIKDSGTATANAVSVSGATISFTNSSLATYAIATFTGGDGTNPLVITFNTEALKTEVQAVMKAITFANSSDAPSTAQRTVSFTLTDGDGGTSNTVIRSIDITLKNDAPVVAIGGDLDYTITTPTATQTLIADAATVTDVDSLDFNGGKLTVALGAGKDAADRIEIVDGDGITAVAGVVSFNGNAIGTYTGTSTLIITFNSANATPAAVQALLRRISFKATAVGTSSTRALSVTLTDGDGGTSAVVGKTITVHN